MTGEPLEIKKQKTKKTKQLNSMEHLMRHVEHEGLTDL